MRNSQDTQGNHHFDRLSILLLVALWSIGSTFVASAKGDPTMPKENSKPYLSLVSINSSPVIALLRQEVSKSFGVNQDSIELVTMTEETWSDGCLGLARSDEFCTQQMVEGWRVILSHDQYQWVYRVDRTGQHFRLESISP